MSDIENRVTQAWGDYYSKSDSGIKPDFICLSSKDHYALSKSLNSDELIKKWNGLNVLITLTEDNGIFFLRK